LPNPLKDQSSGKPGDLPPPDQLKESGVTQVDAPSPPEPVKEQEPDTKEVEAQPEQVAIVTEESSETPKTGGDARIVGIYLGKINERVQRSKVNPHSRQTGVVVLKYTIGIDGSLLSKQVTSSSKSQVLDEAALAALDRAIPFPPIPPEVSLKPMTFTQPFKFIVR
jgi:protein TonB